MDEPEEPFDVLPQRPVPTEKENGAPSPHFASSPYFARVPEQENPDDGYEDGEDDDMAALIGSRQPVHHHEDTLLTTTPSRVSEPEEFNLFTNLFRRRGRKDAQKDQDDDDGIALPMHHNREREEEENIRKLRHRHVMDRRLRPWTICGVEIAKIWLRFLESILPESMRTVHVEAGSQRWYITDRISELWTFLRRPLLVTTIAIFIAILLWWFLAPTLAMLGPAPVEIPPSLRDVGGGLGIPARVDGGGVYMERPMAICDLLYDRGEYAARRDKAWARLYRELYPPLVARVAQNGIQSALDGAPNDATEGQEIALRSNVLLVDPKTLNGPTTVLPRHQDTKRWRMLRESGAVWATPSHRDARMFHEKTRDWLVRECKAVAGRAQFIEDATLHGFIRLDVTDYIEPPPREPTPPPPHPKIREEENLETKEGEENDNLNLIFNPNSNSNFNLLLELEWDEEEEEEEEEEEKEEKVIKERKGVKEKEKDEPRQLMPPPPEPVYRNVSIYDLNMVLFHFAAQAKDARSKWSSGSEPRGYAATIAQSLVDGIAMFRAAIRIKTPSFRSLGTEGGMDETQFHYQLLALQSFVEGKLRELYGTEAAQELRTQALWSGTETGCVCPHHVGVPIPGAAWFEPADSARKTPARVRVLFYPTLEPNSKSVVSTDPVSDSSPVSKEKEKGEKEEKEGEEKEKSGWGSWLRQHIETASNLMDLGSEGEKREPERRHVLEWEIQDPVLEEKEYGSRAALQVPEIRSYLVPPSKGGSANEDVVWPKYWVEGVAYDGWQRRYPLTAASYACVASCTMACGAGR